MPALNTIAATSILSSISVLGLEFSNAVFWTIAISLVLSITCAIAGVLLVAKKEALISEGLSHAVLPGIIVSYIFLRDQQSPLLILSAAASGYLMIVLMQLLKKTKMIQSDAALGVTFSTLFSVGIIIASQYLTNSPVHAHCIIDGNLANAYQNTLTIFGFEKVPKSFVVMSLNLAVLVSFLLLCYKELKLMVFDPVLARSLGYRPALMHSLWLAMVAVICVSAFETAGAVLVVALLIAPPGTAFLLTKKLHWAFVISSAAAAVAAIGGFYLGLYLDISQTGPIASISGGIFLLALFFAPLGGIFSSKRKRNEVQQKILSDCLLGRLAEQENRTNENQGLDLAALFQQIGIPQSTGNQAFGRLKTNGWIQIGSSKLVWVTEAGKEHLSKIQREQYWSENEGSAPAR